jgi:methyl-accepting chemotaxis protein
MPGQMKNRLAFRLMGAIGITLSFGLAVLGSLIIWFQFNGAMDLQAKNTRNLSALLISHLDGLMMKGESKVVNDYIKEMKQLGFVRDLRIFDAKAVETGRSGPNQDVIQALQTGRTVESMTTEGGQHVLEMSVPLLNEQRCRQCHDAASTHLGVVLLSTSVEDGYASAMRLTKAFFSVGILFFVVVLICLAAFCKRIIVRNILEFLEQVREIGRGKGDLTKIITVRSSDEIGQLGVALNELTSKLRDIVLKVLDHARHIAAASHQLYSTSAQMAKGTQSVAAQTASVAVASEEMASTSAEIANNCIKAASASQRASVSAATGTEVVERTVEAMNRIAGRVADCAQTIENLGARSTQIGQIISTIEDIADQTNLLALNAAIEAARAGEHGRGFAVVADEVRALAERTTVATKEIGNMVKSIQKDTQEAVHNMEQSVTEVQSGTQEAALSGMALKEILEQINSVSAQVGQMASAADQQTATTREIRDNIQQVTQIVWESDRGAQESTARANQLTNLAEELQILVEQFKVN